MIDLRLLRTHKFLCVLIIDGMTKGWRSSRGGGEAVAH